MSIIPDQNIDVPEPDYFNTPPRNGIMLITPALAEQWLKRRNKGNRNLSVTTVMHYAEAMTDDRWILTHQGLAFDQEGNLIDGQHRLQACVEAKKSFRATVAVDIPREAFSVVDTGRRRHASQLLEVGHRTTVTAAARILSYITGVVPADTPTHGQLIPARVDNDVLLRVVDQWPELALWAPQVSSAYTATRILKASHLTVVAQAARKPHSHLLESWFEGIISGAGLDADDPRLVLRNRFLQGASIKSGGATRMAQAYVLVVKAWNAYAAGRSIQILKVLPTQKPPKVL